MKAVLITPSLTQLYKPNEFHPTAPGKLSTRSEKSEAQRGEHVPARRFRCRIQPFPPLGVPLRRRMQRGRTGIPRETLRVLTRWDKQAVSLLSE